MRLIDSDALIKRMPSVMDMQDVYLPIHFKELLIDESPTVDAVPVRHGKWIDGHCSLCGCDVPAYIEDWKWIKDMNAKYCPMCGARMDEE